MARAVLRRDGETLAAITRSFFVGDSREKDIHSVNETLLREVAAVSGGQFEPSAETLFGDSDSRLALIAVPCWPGLLTMALLCFAVEIVLRPFDPFGKKISPKVIKTPKRESEESGHEK